MPLLADLVFDLDDTRYGTPIPYAPYHMVDNGYAGASGSLGYESGSTKLLTYITPWVHHRRFCQLMLGDNYVDNDGTNNRIFRILPHRFPVHGYTNMYAVGIQNVGGIPGPDPYEYVSGSSGEFIRRPTFGTIANDNSPGTGLKYAYAKVTVQYGPYPYLLLPDDQVAYNEEWRRFCSIKRTPRTEFLQVDAGLLKWIDSPVKNPPEAVPAKAPIRDQSIDYVVSWHRVPFIISDYANYVGLSNDADAFLSGHFMVPSGGLGKDQMLLVGVQENLIPQPWSDDEADMLYTYDFFFQHKPNGHNAGMRRQTANGTTTFTYNAHSFTGKTPASGATGNDERAVKHVAMGDLFLPR